MYCYRGRLRRALFRLLCRRGQVDLEWGAESRLAVDHDIAATLFHDAVHGREPQTCSLTLLVRGEEGLENTGPRFRIHTMSGITETKQDVPSGRDRKFARLKFIEHHVRSFDG